MYKEHFGLQRALFEGGIAQEESVFLGPRQQLVIANLKIALTTRDSIATLAGPVGVGKTTLASQALRMATTRLALAWIGGAPLTADEMLETLLAEFDFTPYAMGRVERMHTWRQFITELNATDTRVCILVENAQALGAEALQALGPLTAADPNGCPGANLVIMGETGLYEFFENPVLAQLSQRIRSRQRVDPLSVAEVEAYLKCRTAAAGGEFEKLFAPGAGPALHCYTAGIPRVINNVCETALALAAAGKQSQLTPADLIRVADRMYGLAPHGPIPATPKAAPAPAPQPRPAAATPRAEPAPVALNESVQPARVEQAEAAEPPVPEAEPEPVVEDEPVAEVEPERVVEDEPVAEAEPEPVVEDELIAEVEPEPAVEDEPVAESESAVEDEPVAELEPAIEAELEALSAAPVPEAPAASFTRPSEEPPTLTDVVNEEPTASAAEEKIPAATISHDEITEDDIEAAIAEAEAAEAKTRQTSPAAATVPPADLGVEHVFDAVPQPQTPAAADTPEFVVAEEAPAPEPSDTEAAAPAPPPKPEVDPKLAQTLAEAKSIEDISNSMAEALFAGDEDIDMLAAALDAAVPGAAARRESAGSGLSPEETSAVLALAEDAIAEPAEESPESESVQTPPPAEAAS